MSQQETRPRGRPPTGITPQRQIRCGDDEWALFQRAAEKRDETVAAWIRRVAVAAAKRELR